MNYYLEIRVMRADGRHIETEMLARNISLQVGARLINFIKMIFNVLKVIKKGDLI